MSIKILLEDINNFKNEFLNLGTCKCLWLEKCAIVTPPAEKQMRRKHPKKYTEKQPGCTHFIFFKE